MESFNLLSMISLPLPPPKIGSHPCFGEDKGARNGALRRGDTLPLFLTVATAIATRNQKLEA